MLPITPTVLLAGHVELFHWNDNMWLHKTCLSWSGSRAASMGPWWRKCNLVEEIWFRLLDPAAKLSSWRCTSVWTLIGSSGSGIVFGIEHSWGKPSPRIIIDPAWSFPNQCYPQGQTERYRKQSRKQLQVHEWFCGTAALRMGGRLLAIREREQSNLRPCW